MLNSHQVRSLISCLSDYCRNYAAVYLDTIPKLIQHVLILLAVCNFILFMASWSVATLSDMGLNTPLIAFLLCCQNAVLWVVFSTTENRMIPIPASLQPNEFMVGNCFGITIGAALLSMVFSNYFRNVAGNCNKNAMRSAVDEFVCQHKRGLNSVSFWSGLVFWLEFCLSVLIALGRQDLVLATSSQAYEDLSTSDPEEHFRHYSQQQQQQQQQQPQQSSGILGTFGGASFAGNGYATVPDTTPVSPPPPVERVSSSSSNSKSSATMNTPLGNV